MLFFVLAFCMACSRPRGEDQEGKQEKRETQTTGATASWVPPDGKYERVQINGITVPMIEVMEKGTVVLVDTDGVKPRTWEEQFKRKGNIAPGTFDLHKSNTNKNDTFSDDEVDRQGLWVIDSKGNITQK
ncbi:hypothetical protein LVJ94_08520 [Pendulispora rubella]|uniref:Lipoprotein n=1 Tax=Pendulispora rubella TaxID=2741070 RepID=A0ABZ2L8N3_9BACT